MESRCRSWPAQCLWPYRYSRPIAYLSASQMRDLRTQWLVLAPFTSPHNSFKHPTTPATTSYVNDRTDDNPSSNQTARTVSTYSNANIQEIPALAAIEVLECLAHFSTNWVLYPQHVFQSSAVEVSVMTIFRGDSDPHEQSFLRSTWALVKRTTL